MQELTYLASLEFGGDDARRFLHNQLSADIEGLKEGGSTFACLCHPNGRVMAVLALVDSGSTFLALVAASLRREASEWLQRFVLRDDVNIEHRDDLRVFGAGAREDGADAATSLEPLAGFKYLLADQAPESVTADENHWKARELAAGIAWLDEASSATFLPQMLGFEQIGALNYRKGCFPGQEIIARTHYLGTLKRHPWLGTVQGSLDLEPNDEVLLRGDDDEARGVVVEACLTGKTSTLFAVARATAAFDVAALEAGGARYAASGRWPTLAE